VYGELHQPFFSTTSFATAYFLLGVTLAAVNTIVASRLRHAVLLGWAAVWIIQPLTLRISRAFLTHGATTDLTAWPTIVVGFHNAVLVMSAWSQARGGRPLRNWIVVLASSMAGTGVVVALFPHSGAGYFLYLFSTASCLVSAFLLTTMDDAGRGAGIRLATYSFLGLGLCLVAEIVLPLSTYFAPTPSPHIDVASITGFVFLILAASGLLFSRTESVALALAGVRARLGELGRRLGEADATDPLTGFFSRRAFRELVDHVRIGAASARGFVLVLDLDGLKRINDTQGHSIGDRAIYRTARAIESGLRAGDISIRWGGDEFVVVLPGASLNEAERIRNVIQAAILQEGLSASIGISAYGPDRDIVIALREADRLMYVAKRRRRDARSIPASQLRLPLEAQIDTTTIDASA
jgi:diguanylate cyclase (GGDEF)-like protein